jgi:hypothetical protein
MRTLRVEENVNGACGHRGADAEALALGGQGLHAHRLGGGLGRGDWLGLGAVLAPRQAQCQGGGDGQQQDAGRAQSEGGEAGQGHGGGT